LSFNASFENATPSFSSSSTPASAVVAPSAVPSSSSSSSPSSVGYDDLAAYNALPDFAALHLEELINAACSAAT
jgi:hypothetical protein